MKWEFSRIAHTALSWIFVGHHNSDRIASVWRMYWRPPDITDVTQVRIVSYEYHPILDRLQWLQLEPLQTCLIDLEGRAQAEIKKLPSCHSLLSFITLLWKPKSLFKKRKKLLNLFATNVSLKTVEILMHIKLRVSGSKRVKRESLRYISVSQVSLLTRHSEQLPFIMQSVGLGLGTWKYTFIKNLDPQNFFYFWQEQNFSAKYTKFLKFINSES